MTTEVFGCETWAEYPNVILDCQLNSVIILRFIMFDEYLHLKYRKLSMSLCLFMAFKINNS